MKEISLTQGQVALVDDEDYAHLSRYKWAAAKTGRTYYAVRKGRKGTTEKRTVFMHREIAQVPEGTEVDHRDGNGINNQRLNLRAATGTENRRNRQASKSASSGLKGIWQCRGRWGATITNEGRKHHLGLYFTAEDAARAYDAAARKFHGEFARTNFPGTYPAPPRGTRLRPASSRFRGVSFCQSRRKWQASIKVNGRNYFIGRFSSEEDAAEAYDIKANQLLGNTLSD